MSFDTFRRRGAAIAATGALATLAGIGGAMAASKSSSGNPTSTASRSPAGPFGPGPGPGPGPGRPNGDRGWPGPADGFRDHGRPVSSTATVLNTAGNAYITVTENNGKVKSLAGNQLTIARGSAAAPYPSVTLTIPANANIVHNDSTAQLSALAPGDTVEVSQSSEGTFVMGQSASFSARHGQGHGGWGPGDHYSQTGASG